MYLADVVKVLLPSVLPFEIKSEWSSNIQKAEQSQTVDLMVELLDCLTDGWMDGRTFRVMAEDRAHWQRLLSSQQCVDSYVKSGTALETVVRKKQ